MPKTKTRGKTSGPKASRKASREIIPPRLPFGSWCFNMEFELRGFKPTRKPAPKKK
jgi:hypothetical protein